MQFPPHCRGSPTTALRANVEHAQAAILHANGKQLRMATHTYRYMKKPYRHYPSGHHHRRTPSGAPTHPRLHQPRGDALLSRNEVVPRHAVLVVGRPGHAVVGQDLGEANGWGGDAECSTTCHKQVRGLSVMQEQSRRVGQVEP